MDATVRFDTQNVGALPVIAQYFKRLQLAATLNELIPWEGEVPLGTLVEILIANRLLQPKAMFRVGTWAEAAGLTDYYGVTRDQLNDDRLGRLLERLADHADVAQCGLVMRAVRTFRLRVEQIHYDITNVELYGAYASDLAEGEAPPVPMPAYGHTKSGRKNVKQIHLGLNVTSDGGVPVGHLPFNGNLAENSTHLDNLRLLARNLPKGNLLYVADSKLDTPENLLAVAARDGHFLCSGVFHPRLQEKYLSLRDQMRPVVYCPKSQEHLPPEERDQYQATEILETIDGKVDGKKMCLTHRVIFVWSGAMAQRHAATRERRMGKIRADFEMVERNLGKYKLTTEAAIVHRLEQAKAKYSEGSLFDYQLRRGRHGRFQLSWKVNAAALKRVQALEGVYLVKSNLPKRSHPITQVLRMYKQQSCVERRFHGLKGPLAVAPMFLKNPKRMAGLLCILVWALMVLALMERQVRRSLKGKPLYGLYPENRPSPSPTGQAILECFSTLCIVIIQEHARTTRRLAQPTAIQRILLRLLRIPPTGLRTFKRRCGT